MIEFAVTTSVSMTGDTGSGARLGLSKAKSMRSDCVTYTTLIGERCLVLSARHYRESTSSAAGSGSNTILSGTVRS